MEIIGLKFHHHLVNQDKITVCLRSENKIFESTNGSEPIEVKFFGALTHFPKKNMKFDGTINLENFYETGRGFKKVPVWIFMGESNLGKSFLAHQLNMSIFETDSYDVLPNLIESDIIVLGNKYRYTLQDILPRLKDRDIIVNRFEKIE